MIIEFNGLPGCGKSTISQKLFSILSNNHDDYQPLFLQTEVRKIASNRACLFWLFLKYFFSKQIKVLYWYLRLLPKYTHSNIKIAINAWRNYCICLTLYNKKSKCIIISDQYIIQSVLSCFHNNIVKKKDIIQKLIDYSEHIFGCCIFVDIVATSDVASERICARNTHGGRLDDMDKDSLSDILYMQDKNLDIIRRTVRRRHVIIVDALVTPHKNASLIHDFIKGI